MRWVELEGCCLGVSIALNCLACAQETAQSGATLVTSDAQDVEMRDRSVDAAYGRDVALQLDPPETGPLTSEDSGSQATDASIDVAPAPVIACGVKAKGGSKKSDALDASPDAGECAPPPSYCVDDKLLAFYENGRCENGVCQWDVGFYSCPYFCSGGGCFANFTA